MLSFIQINDFSNYLTFKRKRTFDAINLTLYFVNVKNKIELTIKKNLKKTSHYSNLLII